MCHFTSFPGFFRSLHPRSSQSPSRDATVILFVRTLQHATWSGAWWRRTMHHAFRLPSLWRKTPSGDPIGGGQTLHKGFAASKQWLRFYADSRDVAGGTETCIKLWDQSDEPGPALVPNGDSAHPTCVNRVILSTPKVVLSFFVSLEAPWPLMARLLLVSVFKALSLPRRRAWAV